MSGERGVSGSRADEPSAAAVPPSLPRRRIWLPVLTAATCSNYAWQVVYAVHQYGARWLVPNPLSIALVVTFAWFLAALWLLVRHTAHARAVMLAYLVTEVAFYLVHNVSGAFLADLPLQNPAVLIASILGYVNVVVAAWAAVELLVETRAARPA